MIQAGGGTANNQTRTHNSANEITDISDNVETPWADPLHDAAGNMTRVPRPKDLTSYYDLRYDAWNRLIAVTHTSSGAVYQINEYDGLNRRIFREIPDGSEFCRHYYYNEQWQVLLEADGIGAPYSPIAMYSYHPQYIDAVAHRMRANDSHIYLQDANYNVTTVLGSTGTVAERYSYTPYGEVTVLDDTYAADSDNVSDIGNEILFTGRERDLETGLQLNRNRFYHAALGRWINRDPNEYDPNLWNLYNYVRSNPLNLLDPLGLKDQRALDECLADCEMEFNVCLGLSLAICTACISTCKWACKFGGAVCALCLLGCAGVCIGGIAACAYHRRTCRDACYENDCPTPTPVPRPPGEPPILL